MLVVNDYKAPKNLQAHPRQESNIVDTTETNLEAIKSLRPKITT